ncbi:MAG TPA: EVE domain-containing protein [Candidatus Paceibacterota bacterium]|nr:EVE domain-containing protein [Candidatus Paceibacterota bacterium]
MNYWLLKSEPAGYSIDDLKKDKKTAWSGVRNYQARNFMMQMEKGDLCLFYHSGKEVAVVGVAKVVTKATPDETQFDKKSHYFEPRATKEKPVWFCPEVAFVKKFKTPVPLGAIKADPKLKGIPVAAQGSRLSVQPVSEKHFNYIVKELAD